MLSIIEALASITIVKGLQESCLINNSLQLWAQYNAYTQRHKSALLNILIHILQMGFTS